MVESSPQTVLIEDCNQGCYKIFNTQGELVATVCAALVLSQDPRFPGEEEVGGRLAAICPLLRRSLQTPTASLPQESSLPQPPPPPGETP
ncbi:MAG: hypothetical protein HYS86_04170 [Candidatus Chisholmbacteria bacterium]|nr:hypothetical protein [Candidatus Chisholmbacteria bacterium]